MTRCLAWCFMAQPFSPNEWSIDTRDVRHSGKAGESIFTYLRNLNCHLHHSITVPYRRLHQCCHMSFSLLLTMRYCEQMYSLFNQVHIYDFWLRQVSEYILEKFKIETDTRHSSPMAWRHMDMADTSNFIPTNHTRLLN